VFSRSGATSAVAIITFSPAGPPRWEAVGVVTAGVTLAAAAVTVLVLASCRSGARAQQRAGSLAHRAPGPAAGVARWVTGLYAEPLPGGGRLVSKADAVPAAADRQEPWA
jgi:hypothetical protein